MDTEPSYDLKGAAMRACKQHKAGGEGLGGESECECANDMFDLEFGDENVQPIPKYKTGLCPQADFRTQVLEIFPGGLVDWEHDIGMHISCPAILKRRSLKREIACSKPGMLFAALAHKKDSSVAFIVDSGAFKTQVPESMRHKLRDVTRIRAIPLETAGDVHPTCTEIGFMDFRLAFP